MALFPIKFHHILYHIRQTYRYIENWELVQTHRPYLALSKFTQAKRHFCVPFLWFLFGLSSQHIHREKRLFGIFAFILSSRIKCYKYCFMRRKESKSEMTKRICEMGKIEFAKMRMRIRKKKNKAQNEPNQTSKRMSTYQKYSECIKKKLIVKLR